MKRRRALAAGAALVVLAADLVHETFAPTQFHHVRPAGVFVLAILIAAALLTLAPRIPSPGVALGAGIAAGGALGTAVSGFGWNGVPDPLVGGGIAFNLSDIAIGGGDVLLIASVLMYAWTHRSTLREPL
jgi:MFS superfamily sulfate permease-like transporter